MSTINCHNDKDLEKGVETYVETSVETSDEECDEEEIQLLEDSPNGKLVYFSSPYFFELLWILHIIIGIIGVSLTFGTFTFSFGLHDLYYDSETELSEMFSPSWIIWLVINYFLYFTATLVTYIHNRNNVNIGKNALRNLLEEVAETDLMGNPEAWRRIALNFNRSFIKEKYSNPILYSGEQCR